MPLTVAGIPISAVKMFTRGFGVVRIISTTKTIVSIRKESMIIKNKSHLPGGVGESSGMRDRLSFRVGRGFPGIILRACLLRLFPATEKYNMGIYRKKRVYRKYDEAQAIL